MWPIRSFRSSRSPSGIGGGRWPAKGDLCAAAMAVALRRGCHAPKPLMFSGPGFAMTARLLRA